MMSEIYKIVFLLALGQGILIANLLFIRSDGNKRANIMLAVYVLAMLLPLFNGYIRYLPQAFEQWGFTGVMKLLPWFYGPLLYLYCRQMCEDKSVSIPSLWPHIMGPVWALLLIVIGLWYAPQPRNRWFDLLELITIFGSIFGYALWARQKLVEHANRVEQNLASVESVNLHWLKVLVYGFIGLFVLDLLMTISIITGMGIREKTGPLFAVAESVYIFVIGMYALHQPKIAFKQMPVTLVANNGGKKRSGKYDKSSLDQQSAAELIERLSVLMAQEKRYLDNEISLASLATELEVSPHHLSQSLNEQLGNSFYDYINQARITQAKSMLTDPGFSQLAVLDIAYQVGFNNKTSFNNAFKKFTAQTPSQYRKTHADALAA